MATAGALSSLRKDFDAAGFELCGFRAGAWKPRTRPGQFEGVGEEALGWLADVRRATGLPTFVEVGNAAHLESALKSGVDGIWIGARTTTNPFDVQALADALRGVDIPVMVKNPINPDSRLWIGAVERFVRTGVRSVGAIHRGFSYYERSKYRNAPKWQVAVDVMQAMPEIPMFCDPSHMSGCRDYIVEVSQMALDLGFAGLFVESHIDPDHALSDASQQLTPSDLLSAVRSLKIRKTDAAGDFEASVAGLRAEIDAVDDSLLDILERRMEIVSEIGRLKQAGNIALLQPARWDEVLRRAGEGAAARGLDERFVRELFKLIHQASIEKQG